MTAGRRALHLPSLWMLLAALAALTPGSARADEPQPPATAEPAAQRVPYLLRVTAPDDLDDLLTTYLDLARFRTDPALADVTEAEIRRLVAATPAQARSLLETRGYFNPVIRITTDEGSPPTITLQVDPGERTRVSRATVEVQGDIVERAEQSPAGGCARDGRFPRAGGTAKRVSCSGACAPTATRRPAGAVPPPRWMRRATRCGCSPWPTAARCSASASRRWRGWCCTASKP
jgi:hypothetical protein